MWNQNKLIVCECDLQKTELIESVEDHDQWSEESWSSKL